MREKIIRNMGNTVQSKNKKVECLFVALIIGISEIILFRNTSLGNALVDFTYQLENSYRISVGQVPYKDFFLVLFPGIYYLDAAFLKLFHQSNLGQVVLLLITHLLQIIFSYFILKKISHDKKIIYAGTVIVAFSESIFYPFVIYNTASYNLMLICLYFYLCKKEKIVTGGVVHIRHFNHTPYLF